MSLLLVNQLKNNDKLFHLANYGKHKYITYLGEEITIDFVNDEVLFKQNNVVSNEDDTLIGFMLGEIYDIEDREHDLKCKEHVFKTDLDIEYVLHLYEEYGEDELKRFNGKFIICIYDKVKEETIIVNDRYGYYTYFYSINKGKYTFCNDPNILLDYIQKRELNKEAVNEFFNFGYLLDNKTLLKNINKLEPASMVKVKNDEVSFEKYWRWNDIEKNRHITYEQAVEKLGLLWIKAVKKIIDKHEKFILPLSGGLDSRAILAAIDFLGLNYKIKKAVTMGQENCWDYLIAKEICKIANIEHELIKINEETWLESVNNTVINSLGAVSCYCGFSKAHLKDVTIYPILNGLAGDLVLGGSFLSKNLIEGEERYNEYYYRKLKSSGLKNTEIIKGLETVNIKCEDFDNSSFDYYFLNNSRVRNFTVTGTLLFGMNYNDLIPFFENTLINFVYSLPDEWRLDAKLYKDMLTKFFPKFYMDIPWQRNGVPIKRKGIYNFSLKKINFKKYHKNYINIQKSDKLIVLFGASNHGKKVLSLVKIKYKNIIFCDNDSNKWGGFIEKYKIISPSQLLEIKNKNYYIFISSMYFKSIAQQLEDMNINNYSYIAFNYNREKLFSRNFINFDEWIKKEDIKRNIYSLLLKNEMGESEFFNKHEIKKVLDLHMNRNIKSWNDILIVYTFMKFLSIFVLR
ncbi:MAG: hypothetical protein AB2417_00645 [Clostridiaceae bacterium]